MAPIILYDLVAKSGGPYWAPNPYKTRLSLLHKGVDFTTQEMSMPGLKVLAKELKLEEKVTTPSILTPDGVFIRDSWKIAEWLDKTYPDKPSLFLPASKTPVDLDSPEYEVAKNFAWIFTEGFGTTESQWTSLLELTVPAVLKALPGDENDMKTERGYFRVGMRKPYKVLETHSHEVLVTQAKASLTPLESLLAKSGTLFLTSKSEPGFVDFAAYARYVMMRISVPELCDEIWGEKRGLMEWVRRIEERFNDGPGEEGLGAVLKRT